MIDSKIIFFNVLTINLNSQSNYIYFMNSAIVLINSKLGSEKELIDNLKNIPSVTDVYEVYGVYDVVVKVEAKSSEELKTTCSRTIRNMKNVRATLTMIII